MRIFITGASGFIGSAVANELISRGHDIIGLARSDKSADALIRGGITPVRGSMEDLDLLGNCAGESDGVISLAFNHDFSQYAASIQAELNVIEAIGEALKGTKRPFVIASGGPTANEKDPLVPGFPRIASAQKALALAEYNVRSSVVRLAPSVHDGTRRGFVGTLIDIAQKTGVSGFVGDGSNRWSAVHRLDAARLFCLALEKAPAGSILHAVADEGIPLKTIAETIGHRLNVPVSSIADNDVEKHFGWLGNVIAADLSASGAITQKLLDWQPTHPSLLDDLDHGRFFENPTIDETNHDR
jgi:nucleoside-diphosphate-sugar epimerase